MLLPRHLFSAPRKRCIHTCTLCLSKVSLDENKETTLSKKITIPKPTWSISSLQLHEPHPPASMEELQILAKRSILDLRQFNDETKRQLCQDLGNMLHMMKQVQNFQSTTTTALSDMKDCDPNVIYDHPRGVTEAPFRIDDDSATKLRPYTVNHEKEDEVRLSQLVRESYLEPKMKRVGGHQYFEIITAIEPSK